MQTTFNEILENQITPEAIYFLSDLNWTFIIVYLIVLYGMKHTEYYDWFNDWVESKNKIRKFKVWLAGLIIGVFFIIFRWLGPDPITSEYVSQFLRSMILALTFSSLIIDWPIKLIESRILPTNKKDNEEANRK